MGWTAQFTAESKENANITYKPDSSTEGAYSVSTFKALQKGVYRFELYGSGGVNGTAPGGRGGKTTGYLSLEQNQEIYVAAGGPRCAAFVAKKGHAYSSATPLYSIYESDLLFVAGGGGNGGYRRYNDADDDNVTAGGNGGGTSGGKAEGKGGSADGGKGGTQISGGAAGFGDDSDGRDATAGAYGKGGYGGIDRNDAVGYTYGGNGGDGYYGGGGGGARSTDNGDTGDVGTHAMGGGGGSAYIKTAYASAQWAGESWTANTAVGTGAGPNANGYVVVTIIKQYAPSDVTPDDSVNAGSDLSFTISNLRLADLNHSIVIQFGKNKRHELTQPTGIGTGIFTVPQDWLEEIPSATAGTATIIVTTYHKTQQIGTTNKNFTIKAAEDILPNKGTISVSRKDNAVPPEWNCYVQNISGATITASNFTGVYGSSISSYTYVIGNKSHTSTSPSLAVDKITESGNVVIRVTATDTRGKTVSVEQTIYVSPYSPPAWASAFIERVDASGKPYDLGVYAFLTGEIFYSTCEGKNSRTASVYYRKAGETNYTYAGVFDESSGMLFGSGQLDTDYDYDVRLRVTDAIYEIDRTILLNSVNFTMHFKQGGKSVAFGMPASKENVVQLAEGWDIYFGDVSLTQRILNAEAQMEFSVPASAWSRTTDGTYTATLASPDVTQNTQVRSVEFTGGTETNQTSDITWDTQEGAIELETDVLPTGDQEGYLEQTEAG